MQKALSKGLISQSLRGGLIAFLISTALVLLLALVAKMFTLSVEMLPIVNQVLKCVAVAIGALVSIKDDKLLVKALLVGLIFALFNLVLYLGLGGDVNFGQVLLDLGLAEVVCVVVAVLKSRKK
ncbi:MAG: DUF3792 family protein [Clostridia bacterium]|nr:DUF3792 family protein [Clostridia bacterium]